jgi:hypothetical protein
MMVVVILMAITIVVVVVAVVVTIVVVVHRSAVVRLLDSVILHFLTSSLHYRDLLLVLRIILSVEHTLQVSVLPRSVRYYGVCFKIAGLVSIESVWKYMFSSSFKRKKTN